MYRITLQEVCMYAPNRNGRLALIAVTLGILLLACLLGCGCDLFNDTTPTSEVMIQTYNVQNLFDALVTGNEYPEYTPESQWTSAKYRQRLTQTARAITQGHGQVPDIVLLQEIEHVGVLEDLLQGPLASRGYQWYAATADESSAIQVGIISKFPITSAHIHSIASVRSVLEARVSIDGEEIAVFILHAKSRREGVLETEALRIATTRMLADRTAQLVEDEPFLPIVIAGDFNESADTYFRENQAFQTALIPVQAPLAEQHRAEGSLVVGGAIPHANSWYTWWLDSTQTLIAEMPGSYWYEGVWETFDQILLSPAFFDGFGLEFSRGTVGATQALLDDEKHPYRWDVRKNEGISDHLPVMVFLTEK